jgi:hypothetical protein
VTGKINDLKKRTSRRAASRFIDNESTNGNTSVGVAPMQTSRMRLKSYIKCSDKIIMVRIHTKSKNIGVICGYIVLQRRKCRRHI